MRTIRSHFLFFLFDEKGIRGHMGAVTLEIQNLGLSIYRFRMQIIRTAIGWNGHKLRIDVFRTLFAWNPIVDPQL